MPHFLIRGAWKATAIDTVRIVFAPSESSARDAASLAGVFVSTIEALDDGELPPADAGQTSALSRLATRLEGLGRVDDAVATMLQVYGVYADAGKWIAPVCLRVPRYLLGAGRNDDAWRALNDIRCGGMRGNALTHAMVPACAVKWYEVAARVLKADGRSDHERIMMASTGIASFISEFWVESTGARRGLVADREHAVRESAAIAAQVLPSAEHAMVLAERLIPNLEGLTAQSAVAAACRVDVLILDALS